MKYKLLLSELFLPHIIFVTDAEPLYILQVQMNKTGNERTT
jgi:hypothetical protein